ncbi:MAG: GntR family transcriptional regulator [Actinobacteria bacterium]|nr:GntR family transcriptional regulator [Actinomycetota bacterium]
MEAQPGLGAMAGEVRPDGAALRQELERNSVPLHRQVYLDLRAAFDAGTWRPGDRLPPERELAARYGCSLITVRRALDELTRERRIHRAQGRGTFVTAPPIERDLTALTSFSEEMNRRGLDPRTQLIESRRDVADETVASLLGLDVGAEVLFLERLRIAGGEPLLLEQVHLPAEWFPGLLAADLEHGSLYDILAHRYGVRLVRAREIIEPVLPTSREARLLGQSPRRPALLLELVAFAGDGTPVEYCRSLVRGDRAKYYVEARGPRADYPGGEPGVTPALATVAGPQSHSIPGAHGRGERT